MRQTYTWIGVFFTLLFFCERASVLFGNWSTYREQWNSSIEIKATYCNDPFHKQRLEETCDIAHHRMQHWPIRRAIKDLWDTTHSCITMPCSSLFETWTSTIVTVAALAAGGAVLILQWGISLSRINGGGAHLDRLPMCLMPAPGVVAAPGHFLNRVEEVTQ